jgi:hypothetical protein
MLSIKQQKEFGHPVPKPIPSLNYVLYQDSHYFVITGRNKSWSGHAGAEDIHVEFYAGNLKEREIMWKNDMKGYASYKRCEMDSAGLGQGPQEALNYKLCSVALVSQIAIMQSIALTVHK